MKIIIIRHGESEANYENYWTGWLDVPLTEKGRQQAAAAGAKIAAAGINFDGAYTSVLQRAMITCQTVLEVCDQLYIPVTKSWRLNERHYGALVGKNKKQMEKEFGAEQVKKWRRGYYEMPPRLEQNQLDRRYAYLDLQTIPHAENLAMTVQRVLPLWQDEIAPQLLQQKNILVCGHGNSLRALVKYLEQVPEDQMDTIEIPNAAPVLYEFDDNLQIISKSIL
ncbi:2,3-bisphosphoglycerate-dependent phosphoglycerate mutase [Candidatus Enterococcus leclercqii]|uniref:2,3-bisphosphoglycerate-dependent phosphoglycerate mutase n=1 Tax=Candidatus Enterococcus leclercqii TaxID=1857218 RepID=UPI00137A5E1C|nr:2,3-diphosphoglycerate-dependent phosphoglycerate mutase [Enterococcus sp. CU9D]KAF1290176.1 phosphoglyceromutase [Enterococcus sp. CU9D]